MLIDCLARDYREFGTLITSDKSADKLVWLLLIFLIPIIGAIAYHISVRRRPRSEFASSSAQPAQELKNFQNIELKNSFVLKLPGFERKPAVCHCQE